MNPNQSTTPPLSRAATQARNRVIKRIKADHKAFKATIKQFEKLDSRTDADSLDALVRSFVADLQFHSRFETAHLYPAVASSCDDPHVTELAEVEHQSIDLLLAGLLERRPGDRHFVALWRAMGEQLLRHIRREESQTLPLLKDAPVDWPALANLIEQRDRPIEPTRPILQTTPGDLLNPVVKPPVEDHIEPPTVLATPDTPAERRAAARHAPIK